MKRNKNGFTLVEVLAVISLIGVVSIFLIPTLMNVFLSSKGKIGDYKIDNVLDAGKMYITDLDTGVIDYVAPKVIGVNNHTYNAGEILSTYDFRTYVIETKGIEVSIKDLMKDRYYEENGCDYNDSEKVKNCSIPDTCVIKVGIEGSKVQDDKYYVSSAYTASVVRGCE